MFFQKKVNLRSRQAMVDFLRSHYRYRTGNSWNRTSYAHKVKLYALGLPNKLYNAASDVLDVPGTYSLLRRAIDRFTDETDGDYTIDFNGRSGGYLVLYKSYYEETGYKSICTSCGQLNYALVGGKGGRCGVCGEERENLPEPHRRLYVTSESIDQGEDYEEWSIEDLKERVRLVCRFDRACDEMRDELIRLAQNYRVVERTIYVPRTVKELVAA